MRRVGRRDGRNFGYGRQLSYSVGLALHNMYCGGHFGTVKAHCDRFRLFARWCSSSDGPGINDAQTIDQQPAKAFSTLLLQYRGC